MHLYRLVIIDDETTALEQFADAIEWTDYGFNLTGAFSDSTEAMEFIKESGADLVFTDIKMPGYSGIDIAEMCLELDNPSLVVFISAYSDFEYARKAIRFNVCDFIVKPFGYSDIENVLIKAYNILEEKNSSNLFATNLEMLEQQFVFSELVLGNISSDDELKDKLSTLGLPVFLSENSCAIINVTINDFENYIQNTWKHGKDKLYNAISYLAGSKTPVFSSSFAFVNNSFQILSIEVQGNFEKELDSYISSLRTNLEQLLSLSDITIETERKDSLGDFVAEPENGKNFFYDDPIIEKSIDYIRRNYKNDITLDEVAKHISLSRVYFCSYFKKVTGDNFINELNRYRIEKAKELLSATDTTISSVAEGVGYKSIPYFYKTFTKFTGHTPTEYRTAFRKDL